MKTAAILLLGLLALGTVSHAQDSVNATATAAAPSGTGLTSAQKQPARLMFLDGVQQLGFKLAGTNADAVIQHQIFQDDPDNSTETTAITSVHAIKNAVNVAFFPVVFGILEYQELNGIDGFQLKSNERQSLHVFGPSDWTSKDAAVLSSLNGVRSVSASRVATVGATTWNFTYSASSQDVTRTPVGGSASQTVQAGSLMMTVTKSGGANIDDLNQPCLEIIFVTSNGTVISQPDAPQVAGTGEVIATNTIGDEMVFAYDLSYMSGSTTEALLPSINILTPEESGQAANTFVLGFFCLQANEDMVWQASMSFRAASS